MKVKSVITLLLTENEAKILHEAEELLDQINNELLIEGNFTLENYNSIYNMLHDPEDYDNIIVEGF